MNEHIKAWLAALRSGNYEQTKAKLHDKYGFCCVGVECDIVNPEGWRRTLVRDLPERSQRYAFEDLDNTHDVPDRIRRRSGFTMTFYFQLYKMNDDGATFAQIADFIEASVNDGSAFK